MLVSAAYQSSLGVVPVLAQLGVFSGKHKEMSQLWIPGQEISQPVGIHQATVVQGQSSRISHHLALRQFYALSGILQYPLSHSALLLLPDSVFTILLKSTYQGATMSLLFWFDGEDSPFVLTQVNYDLATLSLLFFVSMGHQYAVRGQQPHKSVVKHINAVVDTVILVQVSQVGQQLLDLAGYLTQNCLSLHCANIRTICWISVFYSQFQRMEVQYFQDLSIWVWGEITGFCCPPYNLIEYRTEKLR